MGKLPDRFITICVFSFVTLTSQIYCTDQLSSRNRIGASGRTAASSLFRRRTIESNQQNSKENDIIKMLPGQPPVNFKQYGGYVAVDVPASRFLYYYFVETKNTNNSAPLVLWFNGGPACTSLRGAFTENGPFRIHSDGKTLYENPYSWNNEANILFIESPALVGFSYNTSEIKNYRNDKATAEDNYSFLVNWLERFTEYKGRELYITGESYAGHYISQLAQTILQRGDNTIINLKGILMGNPGLDKDEELKGQNEILVIHKIISQEMLDKQRQVCDIPEPNWTECAAAMKVINTAAESIDDIYNIYSPKCLNSDLTSEPKKDATILKFDPCSLNYLKAYLNTATVQEAIHANTTNLPYVWSQCNDDSFDYWNPEDIYASMVSILDEVRGAGIRVFVFSGDVDAAVPTTSTKYVLKKMNLTTEKALRPWFSNGEVAGDIEEYKGNFTYATVKDAGHCVPSDQPIRALTLFTNFIHNTPLPQQ